MKYPHTKQVRNLREFLGKMKTVLIILIIELYKVKGVEISAAYSSGDCYDGSSVDLTLTCTVTEAAFSGDIFWRRGTDSIASCGYANDNDCVPSAGFIEPRYSFTSDVNKKEFYLKITPINTPVDIASFRCKHGSTGTDELDYSVRECVDCTVPTVANGQVNTTAEKVVEGTVIEVKCNSGYTLEGSAELTCQADQTWDNPVPTCTGGSSPGPGDCKLWICFIGLIVTIALCSGKLSLYFFKILEFKCIRSIEFGVKIVSPSAVICVIGILLAILLCHLSSGCDDDKGWAAGVNAGLVIVCPCGSVGIIIVHFKFTDKKDETTREKTQEHADDKDQKKSKKTEKQADENLKTETNGAGGNKVHVNSTLL